MGRPSLSLLGGFSVAGDAPANSTLTRKARAVVAYLALQSGHAQSREKLAAMLWGNNGEIQARTNLRQALSVIRRALPSSNGGRFHTDGGSVSLNLDDMDFDVGQFEKLAMASKPEQLEQAIDLYRGDLLDGFSLDGEQFEDWLRVERERLRNLAVAALEKLIKRYAASEDHARCVQAATRLLALEPLREDIHRVLMMSYASQGRFTLALKQYELCRDALQRELDVQPEPVTQSLYENLRVRRVKAGKSSIDTQDPTSSRTARLLEMQSAMRRQLELAPAFSDVPVLPDRPSVAIMPFDCELDNADQKYFAGGLTEDITTGLTKFHELFVIDTRSSQAVRELTVDMREIGRKLGVAHIVVGSVRKADDRVRVTAQLIQTAASQQIWAEKYDVALNDIFAVHDDITERIVRTLAGRIEQETRQRVAGKAMQDMAGYDLLLKAREHVHNRIREDQLAARSYLDRAISLNPKFAPAIACYALSYVYEYESPWCQNRRRAIDEAYRLGLEAVALNGNDSCAHRALAWAAFYSDRIDLAKAECELAVNLNRYELRNLCVRSWVAACEGKPAEAMTDMRDELRLSPIFPDPAYLKLGFAEMTAALYQEATESFARMSTWDQLRLAFMAICHARLGQPDKARQYTAKLQDLAAVEFAGEADPLRAWRDYMLAIVRYQHPDDQARFCEGLHKAGLPA